MKLFKNKELTQELDSLDLGIVTAGETKSYEFYVLNDSKALLNNIKFEISHKEVFIKKYPDTLKASESGKLTIDWTPSVTIKEGLKAILKFQADELWS